MSNVSSKNVHDVLSKSILADGYDLVFDFDKSQGGYLYDSRNEKKYLDFFTFFATNPIGFNHPKMKDKQFLDKLLRSAVIKPSNSDIYTEEMASFVNTFSRIAVPKHFPNMFFVSGGTLAIENCLKAAFDWKVRKNFEKGIKEEKGQKVIHFKDAFHGRSGYTLSLTNTDPAKTNYYPKFDWPRINNPKITFPLSEESIENVSKLERESIDSIKKAISDNPDDIAAVLIEPIQSEGGDHHFRKEFFQALRTICDENEIMLIFDEVQTGIGLTGRMWCYEYFDMEPDMIAFGKKTQVCGMFVSDKIHEIPENVFRVSSRINSTFGGNLVDMVRFERYLEIIEEENLVENAKKMGIYLLAGLTNLGKQFPDMISNVRGRGLICAFDLPDIETRNKLVDAVYKNNMIIMGCGDISIRCRPRLNIPEDEIDEAMKILFLSLKEI